MSRKTKRQLEKALRSYKRRKDKRNAKKFKRDADIVSGINTITGLAAAGATPAIAAAGGVGAAASGGVVALAMAVPIGTIIVAVPALIGLGFSAGAAAKQKQAKFLSQDQELLTKLIKRYKRKDSRWRISKSKQFLKKYSRHLDKGNKKTWELHDGNRKQKQNRGWKGKKAELEMKMMAIYVAQYQKNPPSKPLSNRDKNRSQKIIRAIQIKQKASMDPKTSPLLFLNGRVVLDKQLMKKQATRTLQRPTEYSDMIRGKNPSQPQSVYRTLSNASEKGITLPPGARREMQKAFNLSMALKTAGLRPDKKEIDSKTGKTTQYFIIGGIIIALVTGGGYFIVKHKKSPSIEG